MGAEEPMDFQQQSWNARESIRQNTMAAQGDPMNSERQALPFAVQETLQQSSGASATPGGAATSSAAAHAIKALQEKNYRFECDLQVMENLLRQYKDQNQDLEEQLEVERQRNRDV